MWNEKDENKMNITFGENLSKARKKQGISQEKLAEKLNVSRQTISKWENGLCFPEIGKLRILSEILNIKIDEMLQISTEAATFEDSPSDSGGKRKKFFLSKAIMIYLLAFAMICVLSAIGWDIKYPSLVVAVLVIATAVVICTYVDKNRKKME